MRKQVRGDFSSAPVLKCALLLAVMVVRKGGRQEAEAAACLELSVVAEEAGETSRKWDTVFHYHRWCKGGLYGMF